MEIELRISFRSERTRPEEQHLPQDGRNRIIWVKRIRRALRRQIGIDEHKLRQQYVAHLLLRVVVLPNNLIAVHRDAEQLPQLRDVALRLGWPTTAEHAHHAAATGPLLLRGTDYVAARRPGERILKNRRWLAALHSRHEVRHRLGREARWLNRQQHVVLVLDRLR